jgi:acyl carrier protein
MKPTAELESLIMSFVVSNLSVASQDDPAPGTNLIADGYLDSVSIMRLVHHLESSLHIKIPPRDLVPRNFLTVNAMVSYLSTR